MCFGHDDLLDATVAVIGLQVTYDGVWRTASGGVGLVT